jgi:hypothetical protein
MTGSKNLEYGGKGGRQSKHLQYTNESSDFYPKLRIEKLKNDIEILSRSVIWVLETRVLCVISVIRLVSQNMYRASGNEIRTNKSVSNSFRNRDRCIIFSSHG